MLLINGAEEHVCAQAPVLFHVCFVISAEYRERTVRGSDSAETAAESRFSLTALWKQQYTSVSFCNKLVFFLLMQGIIISRCR